MCHHMDNSVKKLQLMTTEIWTMLYWPQAKKKRLLCPSQWHCSQVTRLSDSDVFQHRLIIQSHILNTHDACILFTQNFFFSYAKLGLKAQVSIIGGVLPGFVTGTGTFFYWICMTGLCFLELTLYSHVSDVLLYLWTLHQPTSIL